MILLIDNYDSFTHNLAQLIAAEYPLKIVRNDDAALFQSAECADAIVLSPGPGRPAEAGNLEEVIRRNYMLKPILGICLGHQAIAEVFGATIHAAQSIRHGKQSLIQTDTTSRLFQDMDNETKVMRYHSLVVDAQTLPKMMRVTATALDDQEMMAIEHKQLPIFGVQFHPESIATVQGEKIIKNFIQLVEEITHEKTI